MPHIFLYGPPGTGKSTVGDAVARNLKLPFVDLDQVVEDDAGMPISRIMETKGESAFRELEAAALKKVVDKDDGVIALGGGALLREENRRIADEHGRIVLLMAELDTLPERLGASSGTRPLLAGALHAKLGSLLEGRREHYASFPLVVNVDRRSADENAARVQAALGRFRLHAMGEYDVIVQDHGIDQLGQLLRSQGVQRTIIVTDENLRKFHLERMLASLHEYHFDPKSLVIPAGETYKNLEIVGGLWHGFLDNGLDRKSTVIALGGGVIGDLAGFAASTFMRGIDWVAVPTTLLSMVDASLGGKTGFDLPEGKNLIGSFYPPRLVLVDTQVLNTLPEAELISGFAEVVKHGIISDPELFTLCSRGSNWVKANLEEIVRRAIAVKARVIEQDPYEKGFRAALNLGHTVGHAVELVSRFELRHGEAVAIGIVIEARYAERIGLANKELAEKITSTLAALGLPTQIPDELPREEIIRAMRVDKKKNAQSIRFALPVKIGQVELVDVTDLESVLE